MDFRTQTALARREAGRDVITARAVELFESRDYDGITVSDLAAAAEISERTFYRYFASRDDVLIEFGVRGGSRIPDQLAARPADEPPLQALIQAIAHRNAAAQEHSRAWNAIVARLPAKYAFIGEAVGRNIKDRIVPVLRQRLSAEQIERGDDVLLVGLAWTIVASVAKANHSTTYTEPLVLEAAARARAAFVAMDANLPGGPRD
ncbi:TetR/AcrR family transcriptional regulator [Cryptosporangium phraense]|uniref:TetR/AcrR family transcriptional regulator n=1 Tax=Cryptosporangium phraense TaxID=2593070 RepID=UPI0014792EBF|nr:TetR family transcriptional regulator [Cryptosporangium phraense]